MNGDKYTGIGLQDFVDNKVEQTTGTLTYRATFQNPENRLINGQNVKIKIYANNRSLVPLVPITAVQENKDGKYVYAV